MKKALFLSLAIILISALGLITKKVLDDKKNFHKPLPCHDGCRDFKAERDENVTDGIKNIKIIRETANTYYGAASLAMLINSFDSRSLSEQEVNEGLLKHGDKNKIKEREAFSLLDMKKYLAASGYESAGYKAMIENLKEVNRPAILPIKYEGCKYSPLLEGINNDYIYLADPCLGYRRFTLSDFNEIWSSVCFLIEGKIAVDQAGSNDSGAR